MFIVFRIINSVSFPVIKDDFLEGTESFTTLPECGRPKVVKYGRVQFLKYWTIYNTKFFRDTITSPGYKWRDKRNFTFCL